MGDIDPIKIFECIIDCLRSLDKSCRRALCSCSLACRAFLPRSHHNLFRSIYISNMARYSGLLYELHLWNRCYTLHPGAACAHGLDRPHS